MEKRILKQWLNSGKEIKGSHSEATLNRYREYPTTLAIQDTAYFTHSHHEKTVGLCAFMAGYKIFWI
ncbi:MAG: hypothetical protein SVR08_09215 [Spirochaetota bacterium]|nr:hypothetical protein [Spirochaetota bacterium]